MSKDMLKGKINGLEKIRGYSAYEIAVMHGFDGTEEEWVDSLGYIGPIKMVDDGEGNVEAVIAGRGSLNFRNDDSGNVIMEVI